MRKLRELSFNLFLFIICNYTDFAKDIILNSKTENVNSTLMDVFHMAINK